VILEHDHNGLEVKKSKKNKIYFAFFITISFALVEFMTGKLFNSLALVADSGHMLTDSVALLISSIAIFIASKPANKKYTYGLSKFEIGAAILNVVLITLIVFHIGSEAIERFGNESVEIDGLGVMFVAILGLIINLIVFKLLHSGHQSINTKVAMLHVLGDILGSVSAIASGVLIYFFNLFIFDSILSLIVCIILIKMIIDSVKNISTYLLDAVPEGIDIKEIEKDIINLDDRIIGIHDLHIWKCSSTDVSLTAHIDLKDLDDWNSVLYKINNYLHKKDIEHITIQPEKSDITIPNIFVCDKI
jgi:cobalt-zinc-cadmium efflux system protein